MKPVLFLQNITIEGPGTIAAFLKERNIPLEIRDLFTSDSLPESPDDFGSIVIMGGPMNVDEEEKYPYLSTEKEFIKEAVDRNLPILGICLGAQILAQVLGAEVEKNAYSEIGWMTVNLTKQGKSSSIFRGLPEEFEVFQWHSDRFEIPKDAIHLAYSASCENQAFQYREKVFGLQFHFDVDANESARWAKEYMLSLRGEERLAAHELVSTPNHEASTRVQRNARLVFENFFTNIAGYAKSKTQQKAST